MRKVLFSLGLMLCVSMFLTSCKSTSTSGVSGYWYDNDNHYLYVGPQYINIKYSVHKARKGQELKMAEEMFEGVDNYGELSGEDERYDFMERYGMRLSKYTSPNPDTGDGTDYRDLNFVTADDINVDDTYLDKFKNYILQNRGGDLQDYTLIGYHIEYDTDFLVYDKKKKTLLDVWESNDGEMGITEFLKL